MPIFLYKCRKCAAEFEHYEGVIQDEDALKCPECGSGSADKQFSTFSVGKGRSCSSEGISPSCQTCTGGRCGL